ncbi:Beta-glucan synthesis-associated protein KRE6 [Wickerhamomyces ciferrii]|uniref:Beta-glucan synthesis-associated protein KRE6 n=1 Tax=Wickerhamomyces ciferrii (strain ATCC 14091 / BCRC 22168 / CBS 111 / JCM 3599 / NBRC 0793 / NRRL Y-1031 F-60-10) TaxID=1206466 RepID=K0KKD1_WICCF|nr:Beta-glucan synthesis-associated protein KRE6 [Wickerhamomyces ciferrii]CCH43411.1 Beta-glucan synthesis-associated protein KRE6 [Wickerhamomyces ciferrii]
MSNPIRNLTDRTPLADHDDSSDSASRNDPFADDNLINNSNGSDDSTTDLIQNSNSALDLRYYTHQPGFAGSSNYLNPNQFNSSSPIPPHSKAAAHISVNSNIQSPGEFDRYPSVANSSTNLPDQKQNYHKSTASYNSDSSSSNPFISEGDSNPFGGYPVSAFPLHIDEKEADDYIHNPDPISDAYDDKHAFLNDLKAMDKRSAGGLFGLLFLFLGAIALFVILPALTYSGVVDHGDDHTVYEILTFYQYPQLSAIRTSLVDPDTPDDVKTKKSRGGQDWTLVFSDEFAAEGRTFYDGDDQFWMGPDIHYDATKDLEWYDPDAATTSEGALRLRMDAFENHGLFYRSGMLQSWNKMCFTQGHIEVSSMLPNYGNVSGLWPGIWTLGNLARPGYLASAEAVWPYSYNSCDAGITPNQSSHDGISYLKGQKLNACTCDGEDHPNPGTGRGAPELDILEGSTDTTLKTGVASQSLQVAPYDIWYIPDYDFVEIHNTSTTCMNTYTGGPFQQAVSGITTLSPKWNEFGNEETGPSYQTYAYEYLNDRDDGYVTWFVGDGAAYTLHSHALHPNGNIDWRPLPQEPMSIILNLGISNNWAYIDWASIMFPVTHSIDYVRIYQPSDQVSLTCDPKDYPTYDYIQNHLNAYMNVNLTNWEDAGYSMPKNILTGNCKSSNFKQSSSSS